MKRKIKEMRKMDDELQEKPQRDDLDYQDFMVKKQKKEKDPWMKMYVKGPTEEEQMMAEAKTRQLENPLYERFADRTTRNVRLFFDMMFNGEKRGDF